jgi:VanZ family protein
MRQRLQKLLSNRTPALLLTIFIFILMALPGNMLPKEEKTFIPNLDKLIHATLFGSFVFLWCIYYSTRKEKNNHATSRYVLILIIACLYGVATELMQKYLIPNRDYDIYDIMADSVGALLGYIFVRLIVNRMKIS